MNILLTNDDGINSIGLSALIKEGLSRGHNITICAPATQMSASSHGMTLHEPILVEERDGFNCKAYAVHGTPVDCVRIGLLSIVDKDIDMVISGINNGYNSGRAVIYSGTVAAAREAVIIGVKSIAVSIDFNAEISMLNNLASYAYNQAEKFNKMDNPPAECLLNINAPAIDVSLLKEPVMTFIGTDCPADGYERYESPRNLGYYYLTDSYYADIAQKDSDVDYLSRGHITNSFISIAVNKEIISKDFLD